MIIWLLVIAATPAFGIGQREQGSFEYDDAKLLTVEAGTFDVVIEPAGQLGIGMEVKDKPDSYSVYHDRNGGEVKVWVEKSFSLISPPHDGTLIFRIPDNIDVDIDTSVGDVEITGPALGRLMVSTSTGAITLDSTEGIITTRSSTGDVSITNASGEIDTRTSTGRIGMQWISGPVQARSSTGSQSFQDVRGDIDATSTTGRIEMVRTSGEMNIKTSTGDQFGHDVLLTGPSRFESTTGRIEIDIEQDVAELEFDLRSTTGSLEVDGDRSQRELFLGGAGFRVVGKTSTGSQRYH
jgi:hypothetical protein